MFLVGAIVGTVALGGLISLFGDRYESSPEEVKGACEELTNISNNTLQAISDEIGNNVTIVNNAAYGYVDISNMNTYAPAVKESITNLIKVLDKQADIIEDYNNGSLALKMLGTGTMAIFNLTEGMVSVAENIVDTGANVFAAVGTFFGFDMEDVELWAAKDHVGGWFDDAYENGALSWVEKYSVYSHESTFAEVVKGFGTAIPYIALAATGVGLVAEASIAGAAGFGRGSTDYQQQHLVYDADGNVSFDDTYSTGRMMWEGTKQGAVDAALTVGMDKGFKAIGSKISALKAGKTAASSADDVGKALISASDDAAKAVVNSADDAGKALISAGDDAAKAVVNSADDAGKALISAGDDAAKAVVNSADDAGKSLIKAGDDAAKAAASSADDAGKSLIKTGDDGVKAAASSADDAGRISQSTQDSLSKTKQELLEKMKSGEITRDEMLEGVKKAANPEQALKVDKAKLLEEFKSGKITRDEMIKGIQQSAGNVPAKTLGSQLDNIVGGTINSTDDVVRVISSGADDVVRAVSSGADDAVRVISSGADDVVRAVSSGADDAVRAISSGADDAVRAISSGADDAVRAISSGADDAASALASSADDVGENVFSRYASKMSAGEKAKYANFLDDGLKATQETVEQAVNQTASEVAEQAAKKSGSEAISKLKNAASSAKSKIQDAFSGLKPSGTTASAGPRIGDNSIPARVTQAYDNAVEGIKTAGSKTGAVAKKVATDTVTFVKENPKSVLLGGGVIAAEKSLGNLKTSYIPTDYASSEVKAYSNAWDGDTIGIDEVDDMIIDGATIITNTDTSSGGYTGSSSYTSGTYKAPDTSVISNNTDSTNTTNNQTNNTDSVDDKIDDNKTDDNKTDENKTDDNTNINEDTNNNEEKNDITPTPNPDTNNNSNTNTSVDTNNNSSSSNQGSSGTSHGGTSGNSSYNSSGTNSWNSNSTTETETEEITELEPEIPIEEEIEPSEEIEEESVYTIPSNLSGVTQTKKKNSGTGVLPVLGGLGAAAAVGVGTKMYLDNKKNNENGDDGDEEEYLGDDEEFNTSENDDLLADEWNGEDTESNPYGNSLERDYIMPDDEDLGEM